MLGPGQPLKVLVDPKEAPVLGSGKPLPFLLDPNEAPVLGPGKPLLSGLVAPPLVHGSMTRPLHYNIPFQHLVDHRLL